MPVLAAGPVASAQASAAASIAPAASAPDTGANGLPVAASAAAPGDIGDSNAAEPPAANDQVQAESRQAERESRLLRVICQSHMVSTPIAWESGVEWPRLRIFTSAQCPLHPQSTPEPAQQGAAGDDTEGFEPDW